MPLYKLLKSKIIEGIQCPKRLWYSIHHPELAEYSATSTERLQAGLAVHDVFRTLYPDGILVDDEAGLVKALEDTKKLVAVGTPRIFEATFSYQGVLVSADMLEEVNDSYRLYEVKSSTSVKDYHLLGVSIQTWVNQTSQPSLCSHSHGREESLCFEWEKFEYRKSEAPDA